MTNSIKQEFTVYANVSMPISIPVEAVNEQEAFEIAQYNLYEMAVNQFILNLIRFDNEVLTPKVHDWFINVEDVFEE